MKSTRRRRLALLVASLIVVGVLLVSGLIGFSDSRQVQSFGALIQRVDTAEKVVALTFDDGPTPGDTETLLQVLADQSVKATFFLTGRSMRKHPQQVQEIVASGHQVGNHSWSHDRMWFMGAEEVRSQLNRTDELIRASGYSGTIDFRPPYGKKLFVLPWVLQERGTRTITWDVYVEDYLNSTQTAEQIRDLVMDAVRPGSIILLHPMNGRTETQRAAKLIIEALKQEGYRFATVDGLTRDH